MQERGMHQIPSRLLSSMIMIFIQSCNYTEVGDGRHYHPLNLVRIRLLANMIDCLSIAQLIYYLREAGTVVKPNRKQNTQAYNNTIHISSILPLYN